MEDARNPHSEPMNDAGKSLIDSARAALQRGDLSQAMNDYQAILDADPNDIEALHFVGCRWIEGGDPARGEALLVRATHQAPDDPRIRVSLAASLSAQGHFAEALSHLTAAASATPPYPIALVRLGRLQERMGHRFEALRAYVVGIGAAQKSGRWRSPETTPRVLHDEVGHALRFVESFARTYFEEILADLRSRFGRDDLARVTDCVTQHWVRSVRRNQDATQNPTFLHFPGLPTTPFFPRQLFTWMEALESATPAIREELREILSRGDALQPFLSLSLDAREEDYVGGDRGAAGWSAYFFYRHSRGDFEHLRRCPATACAIEALPLVRVEGAAPEVLFSVLSARSDIKPHRGVTNTRSVVHLPLIVPSDCCLRVGGLDHVWREGEGVVFDDTFEHEAWNRSSADRVVLIADVWNPYLTTVEQCALQELVPQISRVERNLKIP